MATLEELSGGLFAGSPNYSKIAQSSEARRKGLINLGLNQLQSVFEGGTSPFYSVAPKTKYTKEDWRLGGKDQTYYDINRQGEFAPYYAPKGSGVPGIGTKLLGSTLFSLPTFAFGSDDPPTPRELVNQKLKKGLLFSAPENKTFEGFQPEFFEQRALDYVKFALPQFADQYQQAQRALAYGMSNRGLRGSSIAGQATSQLERTAGKAKQSISDTGLEQANQLRRDIEASRQQATNQLYQSADPAQAFQSAIRSASQFRTPSTFAPIANLFEDLAKQYYVNQSLNAYRLPSGGAGGSSRGTYSLAGPVGPTTY